MRLARAWCLVGPGALLVSCAEPPPAAPGDRSQDEAEALAAAAQMLDKRAPDAPAAQTPEPQAPAPSDSN